MTREELEAILLAMLLARATESNPFAQAVADVNLVRRTVDLITKTSAEGTQRLLREIEAELLAIDAQRPGGARG